jgi:hypothetical protein
MDKRLLVIVDSYYFIVVSKTCIKQCQGSLELVFSLKYLYIKTIVLYENI